MTFNYKIIGVFIVGAMQLHPSIFASENNNDTNLLESNSSSLTCTPIPASTGSICISVSDSPLGPYDDVDIYHQPKKDKRILLSRSTGGVATFNGIGFSVNGKYMWESWAEEGHPFYSFYNTASYLSNKGKSESIRTLDDYYFEYVKAFTSKGVFIYSHTNSDDRKNCQDISRYVPSKKQQTTPSSPCYKVIVLSEKEKH